MKELHEDLLLCIGKVGKNEVASLDNLALVNNFVKHLPQKFCTQYLHRVLDTDCTRMFDDLLTYLTCSISVAEHNPKEWVEIHDTLKQTNNNSNRGHSNKTDNQRSSSYCVENTNQVLPSDKVNNTTYASAASGKPDVSNYVCAFCRAKGQAMWRCEK